MPGRVTESARHSAMANGSLYRTGSRTGTGSDHKSGDYPWKRCMVDVEDEELISQVNENSLTVTDPLKHVDLNETGLHIWHIKGGALVHWRREDYGQFYDKDCFLVFHVQDMSYEDEQTVWTLHLWVGRYVSETSFRQAVCSTVSMVGRTLHSKAVVHREAQGHETRIFRKYFPCITYLKGSADDSYWSTARMRGMHQSRLLKCCRTDPLSNHYTFIEVASSESQLNTSFVYILDLGKQLYQWNGDLCKTEDVLKAARYVQQIKCFRGSDIKVDTINDKDEEEQRHTFYTFLSRKSYLNEGEVDDTENVLCYSATRQQTRTGATGVLYRLSNDKGKLEFKKVKNGIITQKDLAKEISCLVDLGDLCILWFSQKVAPQERSIGLVIAQEYLRESQHPTVAAIILTEGQLSKEVYRALHK